LAGETGGRCFVVSPIDPIENIYSQIEEELRSQYGLGFTVDMTKPGRAYRKLRLTTTQRDLTVQTRDGYFPD
jgi:hypothetical protein